MVLVQYFSKNDIKVQMGYSKSMLYLIKVKNINLKINKVGSYRNQTSVDTEQLATYAK